MNDRMIDVDGQMWSLSTIKEALKKHCKFKDTPYQFQAGDVVCFDNDPGKSSLRLICKNEQGDLIAIDKHGVFRSTGQSRFEYNCYRKIGKLSSFSFSVEEN